METDSRNIARRWVQGLGQLMHEYPASQCVAERYYPVPDDIAQPFSQQHLMSLAEMLRGMDQGSTKYLWELWDKAAQEIRGGLSVRMGLFVAVGQKRSITART